MELEVIAIDTKIRAREEDVINVGDRVVEISKSLSQTQTTVASTQLTISYIKNKQTILENNILALHK